MTQIGLNDRSADAAGAGSNDYKLGIKQNHFVLLEESKIVVGAGDDLNLLWMLDRHIGDCNS